MEVVKAQAGGEDVPDVPQGFVISITRGGRMRRAHFLGGCFRIPGIHYKRFESLGQRAPEPHEVTHRCLDCFPAERLSVAAVEAQDEASDSSGEASSSSSVEALEEQLPVMEAPATPGPEP